jgi:hypothetical protein
MQQQKDGCLNLFSPYLILDSTPFTPNNNIEVEGNKMKKKQYDLNFKEMVVAKGKEIATRLSAVSPKKIRRYL